MNITAWAMIFHAVLFCILAFTRWSKWPSKLSIYLSIIILACLSLLLIYKPSLPLIIEQNTGLLGDLVWWYIGVITMFTAALNALIVSIAISIESYTEKKFGWFPFLFPFNF